MGFEGGLLWVLGCLLLFSTKQVSGDALVSGAVFCDQCRDGNRGLFDYPLHGARVAVVCVGGSATTYKEESTNWLGVYSVRFRGSPDLSRCHARLVAGTGRCGAAAGHVQSLRLLFKIFGTGIYTVSPLLSQPAAPMSFCPHAARPRYLRPPPSRPRYSTPPPSNPIGLPPIFPPPPPPPPALKLPPPLPLPFSEASACTVDKWLMPEFRCYWRVVSPDTKVALVFGPVAAIKYNLNMTLWEGLQGRSELYRTLLREGTTALLNSYTYLGFVYPTVTVITHMNWALLGSSNDALKTALDFKRANLGASPHGRVYCNFSSCS